MEGTVKVEKKVFSERKSIEGKAILGYCTSCFRVVHSVTNFTVKELHREPANEWEDRSTKLYRYTDEKDRHIEERRYQNDDLWYRIIRWRTCPCCSTIQPDIWNWEVIRTRFPALPEYPKQGYRFQAPDLEMHKPWEIDE